MIDDDPADYIEPTDVDRVREEGRPVPRLRGDRYSDGPVYPPLPSAPVKLRCDRPGCENVVERDGDMCTDCRHEMAAAFAGYIAAGGVERHGDGICPPDCPICLEVK